VSSAPVGNGRAGLAERLLRDAGFEGVRVEVAGHQDEVAMLRVPAGDRVRFVAGIGADLTRRIRKLGFRYIALELGDHAAE
jgi:hypothetical protein